jgi:hypothetical protein
MGYPFGTMWKTLAYHKPAKLGMVNMASIKMVILGMVYGMGFYLMNGKFSMEILEISLHFDD